MAEFASRGVSNTALGLSIGALGAQALTGGLGNLLGGIGGYRNTWNGGSGCCDSNMPVNRYELNLNNEIAAKDARIGLLESNIYTDQKITDTYSTLNGQINALAAEVRANKDAQVAVNMQQAVYNGTNTAAIGCLQNQIAQLFSLTKLVVPNTSVCPGWGNVTITPSTTTTTS